MAGKTFDSVEDWQAARHAARAAEDEMVKVLRDGSRQLQAPGYLVSPARHMAICQAARKVVKVRPFGEGAAEAVLALHQVLEGAAPLWDAEACRDAALAVLSAARSCKWGGDLGAALDRLAKSVVRDQ